MSYKEKIIAYLQVKRRGKNANTLEREALHDTFLSDALSGYDSVENEEQLLADIASLQTQLNRRSSTKRSVNLRLVAATVTLFLLSGLGYWALKTDTLLDDKVLLTNQTIIEDSIVKENLDTRKVELAILDKSKADKNQGQLAGIAEEVKQKASESKLMENTMEVEQTDVSVYENKNVEFAKVHESTLSPILAQSSVSSDKQNTNDYYISKDSPATLSAKAGSGTTSPISASSGSRAKKESKSSSKYKTISGTIQDNNYGEDLAFASVMVKGTKLGAISDENGRFKLQLPQGMDSATLVFSYIGYDDLEKTIKDASTVAVALTPSAATLDEVVVTGYVVQRRADITGSVQSIRSEEILSETDSYGVEVRLIDKQGASPAMGRAAYKKELEEQLLKFHKSRSNASKLAGTVRVSFMLDKDGRPTTITLVKGIGDVYDSEVMETIETIGEWSLPKQPLTKPIQIRVYFSK